jgi:rod shape-determining protein RodA
MPDARLLNLTRLGWGLAIPVAFLVAVGLACIHATDDDNAAQIAGSRGEGPTDTQPGDASRPAEDVHWYDRAVRSIGRVTLRQLIFVVSGVALMLLVLAPPYQRLGRCAYLVYGLAIFALALLVIDRRVDLPFVPVRRATRRWIELGGLGLQPSEFMKVALVFALARYLRFRRTYRTWRGLIPPFLLTLAPMVLISFQPDLGTLLMLLPVLFTMLFVAGARLRHLLTIMILGAATAPLFYAYGMHDYQKARIDVLLRQGDTDETWQRNEGYQLRQAKTALGAGGVRGEGYKEGVFTQLPLLPEEHNDFIFGIIGHQWGLIGCVLVMLAYALIVLFGVEVAFVTNDPFGRLLAVGVIVMIVFQALLNMCMVIGLAPITGMTLPFVSYGGSSLWANFIALGLLLNVAQRRPMLIAHPPFQHEDEDG